MLAVISLVSSVVLILNTVTALITQQTDQIGILKAIGGTSRTILKVYLTGVLVYGLLALFISLPLGMFVAFGMSQWFLNLFNIDYQHIPVLDPGRRPFGDLGDDRAAAGGAVARALGRGDHGARGHRQLRPGRRLWIELD